MVEYLDVTLVYFNGVKGTGSVPWRWYKYRVVYLNCVKGTSSAPEFSALGIGA